MNLVIRRAIQNRALREFYGVDEMEILSDAVKQEALFYGMFPDKVESGPNKPHTFDWMLSRTSDGSRLTAPRELIHLLGSVRDVQLRKLEVGDEEPPGQTLFGPAAIKEALPEVSKIRLEQTLYAEYPEYRDLLEKLEGEKTHQFPKTLASIWGMSEEKATATGLDLAEIGFFEKRGSREEPSFWVPFLYRDALAMVQGSAE